MSKESDKMKKDTRTKPVNENEPTRIVPDREDDPDKKGWQSNIKQNTTNQGYQQDR